MIGYLYSYAVLFLIFTYAWFRGWITEWLLTTLVFVSLGLAVLQTYVLGNLFGFGGSINRFTTFSDSETFAAFLICLLSLFLFCVRRLWMRIVCCTCLVLGIVSTGSRYVFIGLVFLFLITSVFYMLRVHQRIRLGLLLKRLLVGLIAAVLVFAFTVQYLPHNRLNELLILSQGGDVQDIGTFAFRLVIYQRALSELSNRSIGQFLFGTGTSSAGQVVIHQWPDMYDDANVDGNRSMHNEFLRALYDWGLVGFILLSWFVARLFKTCLALLRTNKRPGTMAFFAIFPTIVIGLLVSNVLAEAGFPGGTAFVCVLACAAASRFNSAGEVNRVVAKRAEPSAISFPESLELGEDGVT